MTIVAHDKNAPYEDVSSIEIAFPEKKYKKLLSLCNLNENSRLGDHQKSQVFVNAIYHFLHGHLSQDDLSQIANHFWVPSEIDVNSELGRALYAAAEMSFYIRRIYAPERKHGHGGFERWMVEVMEYYHRHRKQVVKEEE